MFFQLLSVFMSSVLPVALLVVCGYVFGPKLQIEVQSLSRLAYYLLMPSLVFSTISSAEIPVTTAMRMIFYIFTVHIVCAFLAFGIARLLKRPAKIAAVYVLAAVFGNVANIGLPVTIFHFGEGARVPATLYFVAVFMAAMLIGVTAASWASHGGAQAIRVMLKTPGLLALAPAAFFWTTGVPVPAFLARGTALLGQAMIPVMLVTFGVQLALAEKPRLTTDVMLASAVRLVGGPLLAIVLAAAFGLAGIERGAGILQSAMPPAITISIIAMEHKLDVQFVTATLLFSTLASVLTLTVLLSFV